MKKRLDAGRTQKEIAEEFGVSRSAIGMAMARYELKGKRTTPRYSETIPWTVRAEHRDHWDARMLRLEGRRRAGGELSDDELRWLQGWRDQLDEQNAVVDYNPRTKQGWWWVPRRDEDGEESVIRRPPEA